MLEDVFIKSAGDVTAGEYDGVKSASVTVGAGVINWSADTRFEICNIDLAKCSASAVTVGPVVLRGCRARDSKTSRHFAYFYGTAFSNCALHGNCGRVWIDDASNLTMSFTHIHDAILKANEAFYSGVETAIDLSDAWFSDLNFWGVPLEKVRTHPDRQIKCDAARTAAYLDGFPGGHDDDAVVLLRIYLDRCREKNAEGFLIASAKSGKTRERFLRIKTLCEDNGLLL